MTDLHRLLAAIPADASVPISSAVRAAIDDSVAYLDSDAAMTSLADNIYWPKWHSPWWHMVALFECGEAARIPPHVIEAMSRGIDSLPVTFFPLRESEMPPGTDWYRDAMCHCGLGTMQQIAPVAWGDAWFAKYQMADGGFNCDSNAYLVDDECPSSMVGTIAPFEAMISKTGPSATITDRMAAFMIARRLVDGSPTRHNAEERDAAKHWIEPCFPRFYFYDVIRGIAALVRWALTTGGSIPTGAVAPVVEILAREYPDGIVRLRRRAIDAAKPGSTFPLLDATSAIGTACPFVTRHWTIARRGLRELLDDARVI